MEIAHESRVTDLSTMISSLQHQAKEFETLNEKLKTEKEEE